MIRLKTAEEIKILREGGMILASILSELAARAEPGIATKELDELARKLISRKNCKPSFLNYKGYPAAVCTSVNDEVVHGIPGERVLEVGDLLSLDLGIEYKGLFTDMALTVPIGEVSKQAERLVKVTYQALETAISIVRPGVRLGDLSYAIQKVAESAGFGVVRDLVGHGIGFDVHEEPAVPNFGKPGTGEILQEGLVLAIEPMFTAGDWHVKTLSDGWTVVTTDGSFSAHFEHTVAVTKSGALVLTQ